jgi:hypothetical protein
MKFDRCWELYRSRSGGVAGVECEGGAGAPRSELSLFGSGIEMGRAEFKHRMARPIQVA